LYLYPRFYKHQYIQIKSASVGLKTPLFQSIAKKLCLLP
jgi:hypothetical protein